MSGSSSRDPAYDVLHVQSRAYPLHYSLAADPVKVITVPGHGELRPVAGSLGSLAYNPESTIEVDLTGIITQAVTLSGVEIAGCHARVLSAGAILVTYALRHEADLRQLDLPALDALDARVNQELRDADTPILTAILEAAAASGVASISLRPDRRFSGDQSPVDRRSARYNCHFITHDPPWQPDPRVASLISGPGCRILLPYTYAWAGDPAMPPDEALTMTEPTDIAVAQQSVLTGALIAGRWLLAHLAEVHPENTDVHAFRRFLDGLWADFHQLDSYRVESAQDPRATYFSARQAIGLDDTQKRTDKLLGFVSTSLTAAATERAEALDNRLNRVAAALTVVLAASFGLEVAAYLLPEVSRWTKVGVVVGLLGTATIGLIAVIRPRALRRQSWSWPRIVPADLPAPRQAAPLEPEPSNVPSGS